MVLVITNKIYLAITIFVVGILFLNLFGLFHKTTEHSNPQLIPRTTFVINEYGSLYDYDRQSPIIFIGGAPQSGMTLMRAMLDAHPELRCAEENRAVPGILEMLAKIMKSKNETMRLEEAGITGKILESAMSSFVLEIIAKHGGPAPRLCNKDPLTLKYGTYLQRLFPNGKFLFMVRDGRAVVHSMISNNETIPGFDLSSYRKSLTMWNTVMKRLNSQCAKLGPEHCLAVTYEQLVVDTRESMEKVLAFFELPWTEDVLHHETQIHKLNEKTFSTFVGSSGQVARPVNSESLSKWVGHIPEGVVAEMDEIAPMLKIMGYDPNENPPNYEDIGNYIFYLSNVME